jgi:lipoprotein
MRIRNICLFVLLNVMVVFMSCSDSEYDALRFCDSYGEKELTNAVVSVGENWIRVRGGEGEYAVSSNDKGIAEVGVDKDVVYIRAYKSGVTEITLTDGAGGKVAIPLHVETREQVWNVLLVIGYAEIENEEDRAAIGEKVKTDALVKGEGRYLLTREKWDKNQYEGKLVVYPTASGKESFVGTFVLDESVKPLRVTFNYNHQTHVYDLPVQGLQERYFPGANNVQYLTSGELPIARDNVLAPSYMGEDVTSEYSDLYPEVKRVVRIEKVRIGRFW